MKINELEFNDIITNEDLHDGNLILLASRPAVGKTKTCIELINKFKEKYDYIYFDLSVGGTNYWKLDRLKIETDYKSSMEIIKSIEKFVENEKAKFVIIDYWQVVENQRDWFLRKLLEFSLVYKLVIIITSQLKRIVDKRKNHLPRHKDFRTIKNLSVLAKKIVVIGSPAIYGEDIVDELKYYIYKDIGNIYLKQSLKNYY